MKVILTNIITIIIIAKLTTTKILATKISSLLTISFYIVLIQKFRLIKIRKHIGIQKSIDISTIPKFSPLSFIL